MKYLAVNLYNLLLFVSLFSFFLFYFIFYTTSIPNLWKKSRDMPGTFKKQESEIFTKKSAFFSFEISFILSFQVILERCVLYNVLKRISQ